MANENQFIRGAGMLAVLKVLEGGELYGYAIVEALAKTKGSALHLGQATVYPMLYNLEAKGLVKARWDESGPRPRKYYSLTKAGKTRLADDTEEWSAVTRAMASLGLERTVWIRFATLALALVLAEWTSSAAPVHASVSVPQQQQQASEERAVDAYTRLAQRLNELHALAPDESREAFLLMGIVDEPMQRWLEQVRPLGREFLAATRRPYERSLDLSLGFELTLPHLAEQRALARTAEVLAHDAVIRGDHRYAVDLLGAQGTLARQIGGDGLVVSSLLSMAVTQLGVKSLNGVLDLGAIDGEGARSLLESRKDLVQTMRSQLWSALETESSIAMQEIGRFAGLDPASRQARLALFGASDGLATDDRNWEEWTAQGERYHEAMRAAVASGDPKTVAAEVKALAARVEAGEFGDFLKILSPVLDRVFMRLEIAEAELAAQDAVLADIASGKRKREDFVNAARLYEAAAKAVELLSVDQQYTIEALRLAPDELTELDRREARRAVEALRAGVIDRVLRASKLPRCVFDAEPREVTDLMPSLSEGLLGALRVTLYDPLLPGMRPDGAPAAFDACLATLRAIRHLSDDAGLGRALVAQRVSRDLARALAELDAKGALDGAARTRLAEELARFNGEDPFGIRRAVKTERVRISRSAGLRYAPSDGRSVFSESRLANLAPDSTAFLVAALSLERALLKPEPCECPFDGPLLDVRPLFDAEAFEAARAQRGKLDERMDEARSGLGADSTALRGLAVTRPVPVEERIGESLADFERLMAFAQAGQRD